MKRLTLEWIGAAEYHALKGLVRLPRPYVAKLVGLSERFGFEREFVSPFTDYTSANAPGSRGVELNYFLGPGLYEVRERLSWKRWRKYILLYDGINDVEVTEEQARGWLRHPLG